MFENFDSIHSEEFNLMLSDLVFNKTRAMPNVLKKKSNSHILSQLSSLSLGKTLNEKIFLFLNNIENIPKCQECDNDVSLKDNSFFKGWNTFCSKSCKTSHDNRKRAIEFQNNPSKLINFRESYSKTWHSNLNNLQVVKQQKINRIKTCIERYGVDNVWKDKSIQEKCHKNSIKSGHSYREYKSSISNKIYKIRGYEHLAIDILETQSEEFVADDFATPSCKYILEDKERNYYPDIYIPRLNKIVEVKSYYWLFRQFDKNLAIQKAMIANGFNFEFWVFGREDKYPNIINLI